MKPCQLKGWQVGQDPTVVPLCCPVYWRMLTRRLKNFEPFYMHIYTCVSRPQHGLLGLQAGNHDKRGGMQPEEDTDAKGLVVWCRYCVKWHVHGHGAGHCVEHCHKEDSP